ncbi:MAG: plasmid mobilization relaxosome protein MobC [Hyphomicrobium sp.]|uniref:plasmid mobilization relaxosome protein MobC n=1 Tax=Hyphomicrobium sp. TaxID=82 RepID=UPI003D0A76F7
MARPKKTVTRRKDRVVTFRLPQDARDRLASTAANAGMTLTDLIMASLDSNLIKIAEHYVAQSGAREVPLLPPELLTELRRIGNNVNQIAHAVNSGLPPEVQNAYRQAARLLDLLLADEVSARRNALRMRTAAHGSAHSQTGIELQRGVRVYPARPRTEDS